jgi:hypothetical protein
MKRILSVSLGSPTRNHKARVEFLGEECELERLGVGDDWPRYLATYAEYDGKVDAFGVGGAEFCLQVDQKRYYFRETKAIRERIKLSKVGDGNGVKHLLAPRAIDRLEKVTGISLKGKKAFKTSAVDRWGMAKALVDHGCQVTFGDLMLALGIPLALHSLAQVKLVAALIAPIAVQLPLSWLYPLGSEQEKAPGTRFTRYYEEAEIIAGDFLQVWRYLPNDLSGKIIITNTTTAQNVEELQKRNLKILVTTTPRLEGRSFGTNVMEATLRALTPKPDAEITSADLLALMDRIPILAEVMTLN